MTISKKKKKEKKFPALIRRITNDINKMSKDSQGKLNLSILLRLLLVKHVINVKPKT